MGEALTYLATGVLETLGGSLEIDRASIFNTHYGGAHMGDCLTLDGQHSSLRRPLGLAGLLGTMPTSNTTKAQERRTDRRGKCSPLERSHVVFEHLHKGEDPMVTENHALRQAEVEFLHRHQLRYEHLSSGQQHVKQIPELLLRLI